MTRNARNPWVTLVTLTFTSVARLLWEGIVLNGLAESRCLYTADDMEAVHSWLAEQRTQAVLLETAVAA